MVFALNIPLCKQKVGPLIDGGRTALLARLRVLEPKSNLSTKNYILSLLPLGRGGDLDRGMCNANLLTM